MGFVNPPLCIEASGRAFTIRALNSRGEVLLAPIHAALGACESVASLALDVASNGMHGTVKPAADHFTEEERSRQHSIFSVVRCLRDLFSCDAEPMLGLYGAFGYDLTFQFEPVRPHQTRVEGERDLLLYLPDELLVVDIHTRGAWRLTYDFSSGGKASAGLPRAGSSVPYVPLGEAQLPFRRDHEAGAFASKVARAKKEFEVGNLFEVVLSQNFAEPCPDPPSEIFRRLRSRNPSPYGFLINLGVDPKSGGSAPQPEYLVGASPEMFVRVERDHKGWRCETCPISGTIRRGADAMEDAKNIQTILSDKKEESELTMCTDVDRNDKSRICRAGSVAVIGRRQIEMYSRLIHTVDHVEGYLRDNFDAMDAFLAHTWAVTVTGAPKPWAIQFVEDHEESPRHWYGGAVGMIGFDGCLNTGLTLRTVRISGGFAQVRAGATLLYDSDPTAEEKETELKASAMRDAVLRPDPPPDRVPTPVAVAASSAARVVLVDHQDSFVHTLANYLRQTGAHVTTLRFGFEATQLDELQPSLVVLSPGPGRPSDFKLRETIKLMLDRKIPLFGVCLGCEATTAAHATYTAPGSEAGFVLLCLGGRSASNTGKRGSPPPAATQVARARRILWWRAWRLELSPARQAGHHSADGDSWRSVLWLPRRVPGEGHGALYPSSPGCLAHCTPSAAALRHGAWHPSDTRPPVWAGHTRADACGVGGVSGPPLPHDRMPVCRWSRPLTPAHCLGLATLPACPSPSAVRERADARIWLA